MIDPAVKIATAFFILLGGVCAACLFHRDANKPAPPTAPVASVAPSPAGVAAPSNPVEAATTSQMVADQLKRAASNRRPIQAQTGNTSSAIIVKPLDRREPPPQLAESYPESNQVRSSSWGVSMSMLMPVSTSNDGGDRTHRVVDGDTLSALGQRYLGSVDRAQEIYEANRNVLSAPEPLPIGVELKIPPRVGVLGPPQSATLPAATPPPALPPPAANPSSAAR